MLCIQYQVLHDITVPDMSVRLQQNTRLMRSISVQFSLQSASPFSCSSVSLENKSKWYFIIMPFHRRQVHRYTIDRYLIEFEDFTLWMQCRETLQSWWRRSGPHKAEKKGCLSLCSGVFPLHTHPSWEKQKRRLVRNFGQSRYQYICTFK